MISFWINLYGFYLGQDRFRGLCGVCRPDNGTSDNQKMTAFGNRFGGSRGAFLITGMGPGGPDPRSDNDEIAAQFSTDEFGFLSGSHDPV
jgi:hypothetical protein